MNRYLMRLIALAIFAGLLLLTGCPFDADQHDDQHDESDFTPASGKAEDTGKDSYGPWNLRLLPLPPTSSTGLSRESAMSSTIRK